ncbi:hypothetical protein [Actinoplanes sp. NPDC049265]|uniref:hypothetical protein n=1 Tax=Actinoplanes sp. NPDC049265 TaxID=3363902 RepID=UPI00372269CF
MHLTYRITRPSQFDSPAEPASSAGVPRDRYDRPLIHIPGRAKPTPYTRCTTFVDCIEDKSALNAWGKRMVLVGAAHDPALVAQARQLDPLDPAGKRALNSLAERATALAGAHAKREKGTHLHKLSEYVDRGEALPGATDQDVADMAAYKAATLHLDVVHVERLVVVDALTVAGTPDRICFYAGPGPDGTPFAGNVITDLKTGSVERGGLKMAMQLAVYSRGQFYDHITQARSPLPDVSQQWGLIIHLPAGTGQCTVYWIDLTVGWQAVLVAQQVRALRSKRRLMIPFRALDHSAADVVVDQ